MNYKYIYENFISSRVLLKSERIKLKKLKLLYFESHHIIPKCLGGKGNNKCFTHENIVLLTRKEHIFAHLLLTKIYNNVKILYSYNLMIGLISLPIPPKKEKGFKPKGLTMKDKIHSKESKVQISQSLKEYWKSNPREKLSKSVSQMFFDDFITCPYCNKISKSKAVIKRFHFDNCKQKTLVDEGL